jgi:Protein of unknown function (DUF3997)
MKLLKYLLVCIVFCLLFATLFWFVKGFLDFNHGGDFTAKLCGGYQVIQGSAHTAKVSPVNCNHKAAPFIPAKVVELGNDERFIIAKQNHLKRLSPDRTYMVPVPGIFSYWILDTTIPKAYGPLTENEFKSKRQELKIPQELTLKDVNSYRR